jgi:hypothetical protein
MDTNTKPIIIPWTVVDAAADEAGLDVHTAISPQPSTMASRSILAGIGPAWEIRATADQLITFTAALIECLEEVLDEGMGDWYGAVGIVANLGRRVVVANTLPGGVMVLVVRNSRLEDDRQLTDEARPVAGRITSESSMASEADSDLTVTVTDDALTVTATSQSGNAMAAYVAASAESERQHKLHPRPQEAERIIERLRDVAAVVHIADSPDVTDWQRGYRACSEGVLAVLAEFTARDE